MNARAPRPPRHYLAFYWPLALTSVLGHIEGLCQNRILATGGEVELSVYANAHSAFMMVTAFLAFMPQLVTMYGRRPRDRRTCRRFVILCGMALALPLGLSAYSPLGALGLTYIQRVPPHLLSAVQGYLAWLAPLVVLVTLQQYITGRMVMAGRTRAIIRYNLLHLAILIGLLEALGRTDLDIRWIMAISTGSANLVHTFAAGLYCLRLRREDVEYIDARVTDPDALPGADGQAPTLREAEAEGAAVASAALARNEPGTMNQPANELLEERAEGHRAPDDPNVTVMRRPVTFADLWAFYWPMAMTGVMFAVSRPIIYYFVNQLPAEAMVRTVAVLRVAFDTGMFFQAPVNQFRHVYAQYGAEDARGVRRFMLLTTGVYVGFMVVVALTPLGTWLFADFMKLDAELIPPVRQAFLVMCFGPAAIGIRNVFHGELIIRQKTRGMASGGLFRTGSVFAFSALFYYWGWLNHMTGAAIMVAGFGFEAWGAYRSMRRLMKAEKDGRD